MNLSKKRITSERIKRKIWQITILYSSLFLVMVKKKKLKEILNLNFVDLTNKTYLIGKYDLPYLKSPNIKNPDYLALYSERCNYFKTENTWLCFYQFDKCFDTINGIFNAIYYNDKNKLNKIKERFKGIKYAIAPDYSQCGDIPRIENIYRIFKSRIVSLWLLFELDIIVIPNITYANENYFDVMFDGLEKCEVVSFSFKGSMKEIKERELLKKAIKLTIEKLTELKKIIIYTVSIDELKIREMFQSAIEKEIEIIIPNNILKERNLILSRFKKHGQNS